MMRMKILGMSMVALAMTVQALAMPTRAELSKAQPLVNELMSTALDEYKSASDKAAAAVKVGDESCAFASEAETEAVKFLLLKGAVNYYVRGEAYDKAADCIATMQTGISNLTPDVVVEIVGKATSKTSESKAPRLIAYYRAAKLQIRAKKELPVLEQKLKRVKSEQLQRQYAEALAISGNWKAAYDAFAKVLDKDLVQIAKAEAKGAAANEQAAEFWWNYAPEFDGAGDFFKVHAVEFYQKAIEKGEISGLKKNIVERRIAQINEAAAATNVVAAPAAGRSSSNVAPAKRGKTIMVKIKNGVELEFLPCPPGTFTMGHTSDPDDIEYKHEVTITRPFWMSKYPITVEQFDAFCPVNGEFTGRNGKQGEPKAPVCLRIENAKDYFAWLNRRFSSALPKKCIFRLPTDAEWEYALFANSNDVDDPYVRFRDGEKSALQEICGKNLPVAVGTAGKPNAWGIYDMIGNGCHYVLDTISSEYIQHGDCFGSVEKTLKWSYKESETDPLRMYVPKDSKTSAHHLMRGARYVWWDRHIPAGPNVYYRQVECGLNRYAGPRMWTFRVVIGPDLVAEKMAKSGKK